MKERTREIVRDGFGSLVNNAACIRGAKNGPLWLTIVMFFLSLFLPVIPVFVTQANVNGSSFLNANWYGLENYVTSVAADLKNDNVKFTIGEDHLLSISKDGSPINYANYGSATPFASYIRTVNDKQQYALNVYVSDKTTTKERNEVNKAIASKRYALDTITPSEDVIDIYAPSYIVFFPNAFKIVIYANNQATALTGSALGDYKTMKATDNGLDYLLEVKTKDGSIVTPSLTDTTYTHGVLKNFKVILNKSYETSKIRTMWATSGIYLGIFAGLSLLMGFLMWILTRGKNNPNNYYSPWLTMKIQARLGLAPAIIATVVGFFLPNYIYIAFILLIGLRVMWMSMKELRPVQQ